MVQSKFKSKTFLPTIGKYCTHRLLMNQEYVDIGKLIQNKSDDILNQYMNDFIREIVTERQHVNRMTKIDKMCLMLNVYILSVSPQIQLRSREDETALNIDLYDILDRITNHSEDVYNGTVKTKDVVLEIKTPDQLYDIDPDQIMINCLSKLKMYKDRFDLTDLTNTQKSNVLGKLPAEISNQTIDMLKQINTEYQILVYNDGEEDVTLGMYDNTMFEFLKLCYTTNLEVEYYNRYIATKHINMQCEYIDQLTPAELSVYLKFLEKEIADQEKSQKKQQGGDVAGSLPVPGGQAM